MRRKRNRYKNSLNLSALVRWVSLVALLGIMATSYVYIKNQHVSKSDRKKNFEEEIKQLEREIETIELKLASRMDRPNIHRALQFAGSELSKIDPHVVEHIEQTDQSAQYAWEINPDN